MNKILSKLVPGIPVIAVLASMFFQNSCANTTTPPSGGDKDTIPPVIVGLRPLPNTVNVPVHDTKIYITFNEYVTVKEPKNIFLSPPLQKNPRFKMHGKTLLVYFENDLEPNTTYTLDLTGAVADNNEGNMYPGYTLTFSTGDTIDDKVVTGSVYDCNTLQPVKGATVMLYKDLADSAVFKHRPIAAVKTDDWGYFAIRNVADTLYRIYAVMDEAGNNIYDPDADKIAFTDSMFRPVITVSDTIPELLKYDMRDTVNCMARRSEHELFLFRERPSKQLVKDQVRTSDRSAYVTFMAPDAKIDSLWIRGLKPGGIIAQFNPRRDSLELWVNDRRRQPDTLHLFIDYLKTDSSGVLVPYTEHLRLAQENAKSRSRSSRRDLKHEDTTCVFKLTADPKTVEQYGFQFEFNYPLINAGFDSVSLKSVNPRQQEAVMKFKVSMDSVNLRKFTLMPDEELKQGFDYILKVPHRKFRDINGFYNDSTEVKVALPKDDKLSTMKVSLTAVNTRYIVDLLNDKRDKVLRSFIVSSDSELLFPYLSAGKYSIRLTEDKNSNGIVDTGSLLEHRQPEKVKFFKLRNGSFILDIPEATELSQSIDVAKLFED